MKNYVMVTASRFIRMAAAAVALALVASVANATTYQFSMDLGGGDEISGFFDGDIVPGPPIITDVSNTTLIYDGATIFTHGSGGGRNDYIDLKNDQIQFDGSSGKDSFEFFKPVVGAGFNLTVVSRGPITYYYSAPMNDTFSVSAVPEPAEAFLLLLGLSAMMLAKRQFT